MTVPVPPPALARSGPAPALIPDTAPFSPEQREWLNGFFAGLLALDTAGAVALPAGDPAARRPGAEAEDAPWHDPALALPERLALAEGRALPRRLYAAMAQQDCGQCGYVCETYAAAIASGAEGKLNLCAPGGKDTFRAVKALAAEVGAEAAPAAAAAAPAPAAMAAPPAPGASREAPVEAVYLGRRRLNGEGSERETYHHEFDISGTPLVYEAGDSLGLLPRNDPRLADAVIGLAGLRPEHVVDGVSVREALISRRSLGAAPDALFALLAQVLGGGERRRALALAQGEDVDGDLAQLDVLAALRKLSNGRALGLGVSPEAFLEALDELQPRLYSISSSLRAVPGRVALTVDAVRYAVGPRERLGVASTFLAERLEPGATVGLYVQKAHGFALPADNATPIVMVGPGTGIAPFRAFLQEREARGGSGANWLVFGHQREACDYFYREEIEAARERGHLTRLSLAWSRDGAIKVYVQDRLRQEGAELWAWLAQGAHVYVCGDAKRMARDVERAVVEVAASEGGLDEAAARAFVANLKAAGRYQADVY